MAEHLKPDFFISHNRADASWAVWIAETLESNGYHCLIQEWDFRPGHNFVVLMQEAAQDGTPVIAVLSPDYLASNFGTPEWTAAFAGDPKGTERRLIPVIVQSVERSGLLNQIVPIQLVGLAEEDAIAELLAGVGSGRRKPATATLFPGSGARHSGMRSAPSGVSAAASWEPLEGPIDFTLRQVSNRGSWEAPVLIELYLLPIELGRLQMRELREAPDELAALARSAGFFGSTQALDADSTADSAFVRTKPDRETATRGLAVTRNGELQAWDGLASDTLGAVIDTRDVEQRVTSLIQLVVGTSFANRMRYAPAARILASGMYTFGDASLVGHRNSAGGLGLGGAEFVSTPEDTVPMQMLRTDAQAVAAELTARLEAQWRTKTR